MEAGNLSLLFLLFESFVLILRSVYPDTVAAEDCVVAGVLLVG